MSGGFGSIPTGFTSTTGSASGGVLLLRFTTTVHALNYNNFLGNLQVGGSFNDSRDGVITDLNKFAQIPIKTIIRYNGSVPKEFILGDDISLKARTTSDWI